MPLNNSIQLQLETQMLANLQQAIQLQQSEYSAKIEAALAKRYAKINRNNGQFILEQNGQPSITINTGNQSIKRSYQL